MFYEREESGNDQKEQAVIEAAAHRTATRAVWLGVKKTASSVFAKWVWARSLCTDLAIVLLQVSWQEYAKHKYIGDHCQADRIWRFNLKVNEWLAEWSWLEWKHPRIQSAWLRNQKIDSWTDLAASRPIEQQKLPDIEIEVKERYPDGEVHTVRKKAVLVDAWVEEAHASQDGGMSLHLYDGPSLRDKLMKDGSLRPPGRAKMETESMAKKQRPAPSARAEERAIHGRGVTIRHTDDGEVAFAIHGEKESMYIWQFPPQAARKIAQELLREADSAETLLRTDGR